MGDDTTKYAGCRLWGSHKARVRRALRGREALVSHTERQGCDSALTEVGWPSWWRPRPLSARNCGQSSEGDRQTQHIGIAGIRGGVARDVLDALDAVADRVGVDVEVACRALHGTSVVEEADAGLEQVSASGLQRLVDLAGQGPASMPVTGEGPLGQQLRGREDAPTLGPGQ